MKRPEKNRSKTIPEEEKEAYPMKSDSKRTSRSVFPDGSSLPVQTGIVSGVVKVHESVVCSIIRKAACSVPGVMHLAGNSLIDNIAEFVGSSRNSDRAISLEMGENTVTIQIRLVLVYGVNVGEVARNVQQTIAEEVGRITGMEVPQIDVIVSDLEDPPEENEADGTSSAAGSILQ